MERPTKTITTVNKVVVVVKEWLTAGENQELQRIFLNSTNTSFDKGAMRENPQDAISIDGLNGDSLIDMQNKMVEINVVSIDGKTTDILKTALNLRSEDFDEIMASLNESEKKE